MCHLWSECQFFKCGAPPPKENTNKYHAEKCEVDGIRFPSQKEARRYCELKLLEKAGRIRDLKRQVKFVLIPKQVDDKGKCLEREVAYYADYTYFDGETFVVEDCKGVRTEVYKLKRKLMLWVHKIRVKEV